MTEWIIIYHDTEKNRVNDALRNLPAIEWDHKPQTMGVQIGDIVYLYEAAPIYAICWKCRVTDVLREKSIISAAQYFRDEDNGKLLMEFEPLYEYPFPEQLSLDVLRCNGYKGNMQGPFRLKVLPEMENYIHQIDKEQTSATELKKVSQRFTLQELKERARKYSRKNPAVYIVQTKQFQRNFFVSEYAKRRAGGCCELCGKEGPFLDENGKPYLEIHHVEWLSKGGADSIRNTVALCPNWHKKMHIIQDVADISYLKELLEKRL